METTAAMRTRASERYLVSPAPSVDEVTTLLGWASRAPDHGRLLPWRVVLVGGRGRRALGESLAATVAATVGPDAGEGSDGGPEIERARQAPMRAPLLVTIVFAPVADGQVPEWEQLAAVTGMVHALQLLLHDRGYGSIWRTGRHAHSAEARTTLDLRPGESLLGWLYVGTPDPERPTRLRTTPDVSSRVSVLGLSSGSAYGRSEDLLWAG